MNLSLLSSEQSFLPDPSNTYLAGADNHNLGNTGGSWYDPTTWGTRMENAGKFLAVSALSGADSLYNSAVTGYNYLGGEAKISNTGEWITSLDQDLGQYYSKNREDADLAGFVLTSLVPGMAGVKVLNAGQKALQSATQAGKVGYGMSKYTGLLAPNTEIYVALASAEIKAAQTVFSTINSNSLLAIRNGVWQNSLEAFAFEGFVQATMFKSPILEDQSAWDITKNMAVGTALGGAIGGTFFTVKALGQIKAARVAEDIALKPINSREIVADVSSPAEKIILAANNRTNTATPILQSLPENATVLERQLAESQYNNALQSVQSKSTRIDLDITSQMHAMSYGKPLDHVNALADSLKGMDTNKAVAIFAHADEIVHPSVTTKAEALANKSLEEGFQTRWLTIAGDGAGNVNWAKPAVMDVADTVVPKLFLNKSESLKDAITRTVDESKFNFKNLYNPIVDSANTRSHKIAQLRSIWMDTRKSIPADLTMHKNDTAFLERMVKDQRTDFTLTDGAKEKIIFSTVSEVKDFLLAQKVKIADEMIASRVAKAETDEQVESTVSAIAKTLNISPSYLRGDLNKVSPESDFFHWQTQTKKKVQKALDEGRDVSKIEASYFDPKTVKINYKIPANVEANAHTADHLAWMATQQKMYQDTADRVFLNQAGSEIADRTVDIASKLQRTNSFGAGAGFLKSAQGAYGSPEAAVQYLGLVTKDLELALRKKVEDTLTSSLYNLKQNQEAVIEWSALQQKLSRTPEQFVFDTENFVGLGLDGAYLVNKKLVDAARKAKEAGKEFNSDSMASLQVKEEFVQIRNPETLAALQAHHNLTRTFTSQAKERYAALGKIHQYDSDVVRAIKPDPKDYPFFAFVTDPKVTGSGRTSMLFANTDAELNALINKTRQDFPDLRVNTKGYTEAYYQARQAYEYDMGLNENYIDSALKSKGVYSNFYTQTDPQKVVDEIIAHHYKSANVQAADLMRVKYNSEFTWLEKQADEFADIESSKFGPAKLERIKQDETNPYISYIKTALNISSTAKSNTWRSLNSFLDTQVSKAVGKIQQVWDGSKSVEDLGQINKMLDEYGINTAFKNSAELALINHSAPKAELSKFVSKANAVLSRITLGLDPLNAINNAIGSNVLRMTELTSVVRNIKNQTGLSGELEGIIKIPGLDRDMLSPAKLMANSLKRSMNPDLVKEYKDAGIIRDRLQQFNLALDDITLKGSETVPELNSKVQAFYSKVRSLADSGEKITGNSYAEELNRFVSADVMRQLTDVMEKHKGWTRQESLTYINTFVARVENSMLASQRPGIFQGPMGQALGLFQSYQFNLIQQIFRYVAEGTGKDAAMFLGMQGTLYGLQGMPGFKFINEHIIGTASGNTEHRDMYDMTRGVAGKEAGNMFLYGIPSNIMQTNIYTRGDVNPRHITIIPTNLEDVPFISAFTKFGTSVAEGAKKIANGGDMVESVRQAIEHNGISRPLAGMAQVSRSTDNQGRVFSVSTKGTIMGENDLLSLATLSRLAGGRPLDEAVLNETTFQVTAYEAKDRAKKKALAETIKSQLLGSGTLDGNEYNAFAEAYARLGGKQSSFNKYVMEQYVKANTSQAQIISDKVNTPLSYKVQQLLGGSTNESQ